MSSLDYLELCRLCLVKDNVNLAIFSDDAEAGQIHYKISAILPVKVEPGDKLPKKICQECGYKVELLFQFMNTSVSAEKQLLHWLGEVDALEDKQGYVTEVLDSDLLKQERSGDRLDSGIMQVTESTNIDMNMIDNISIITMPDGSEQQFTTVPIDDNGTVQTVQVVAGPSTDTTHDQIVQSQVEEVEEEEDNYDDGCDNDDSMAVKEESEDPSERNLEPTFVNVTLPCDEAGPSGLQQKISDMSEMTAQTADDDPKPGTADEPDDMDVDQGQDEEMSFKSQLSQDDLEEYEALDDTALEVDARLEQAELLDDEADEQTVELVETPIDAEEDAGPNQAAPSVEPIPTLLVRMASGVVRRLYQCNQCQQMFPSIKQCARHMSTGHPQERKLRVAFRCKTCQKIFKTKYGCETHIQSKHKQRSYMCRFCGFSTASINYIKKHERNHTNDFDIKCEECGKGFASKALLERHMTFHTKAKPFTCDICGSRYADNRSLKLHATIHNPEGRPNKYKCEVCDYSSFWKNAVKTHMKIHTGAKVICDECGQAVCSNYYLNIHKRIHRDEKPHVCSECGKAFRQSKNLYVHQRTHTKVKPYHCDICNKDFSQNVWLKKHKCNPFFSDI